MAKHDHDHSGGSDLSEVELRVRALETILVEKGYIESAALDRIVELYETKIGPHIGAQVVAKAWSDPGFRQALLDDASKALAVPNCEDYYNKYMSPNFRKVISKKALESLIQTCKVSLGTREMLMATVRIVKDLVPTFEFEGQKAVYDVSGQGLPFDRFVIEQVDRKWYIAE